jgi:hypothetical protein
MGYDEVNGLPMQYQYYDPTKTIMNELSDPELFGISTNDWTSTTSNEESDILARVLAASQQEYLESLKAKRQQQQQQH